MKRILTITTTLLLLGTASLSAAKPVKIVLWQDGAPTKNGHENT